MSDIFISYASEDREWVRGLASALEGQDWSVWWDRRIPTGRSFDEVIEEALGEAKAIVVVWTEISIKRQWVKNEAREGLHRNVLYPVMQEEVRIPLEFRHLQSAQLRDWIPGQPSPAFDQLVQDLSRMLGPSPSTQSYVTSAEPKGQPTSVPMDKRTSAPKGEPKSKPKGKSASTPKSKPTSPPKGKPAIPEGMVFILKGPFLYGD